VKIKEEKREAKEETAKDWDGMGAGSMREKKKKKKKKKPSDSYKKG